MCGPRQHGEACDGRTPRESVHRGVGEGPDGRVLHGSERRRGTRGVGPGEGNGPVGLGFAGEEKRDRENGDGELGRIKGNWAGPKERKEREISIFLKGFKQFNSNLNSREFKLELNNKQ